MSKGKTLKVGFNFKSKKSKPAKSEEEEDCSDISDDSMFSFPDKLPSPPTAAELAAEEASRKKHEEELKEMKKDFAEFSRKMDEMKEADRKREEDRKKRIEEEENRTGIDARWPVDPTEYLEWVKTEPALDFFRSIVSEERDEDDPFMARHNLLVHWNVNLYGLPLDEAKSMCRLDFLDDDDGYWEDEIKK